MSDLQRYEPYVDGRGDPYMDPNPNGEWVRWDDVQQRIAELGAEVVSLRATEARLRGLLKAIHTGITVVGEGIPFNYDTWEQLEEEVDGG